jgi:limonene-1,2-epoxide hydrolase
MSVVRDFEKAFNRQDVDALVACFTPGATYTDTFFGPHTGTEALRAMFARMFHEGRDYSWVRGMSLFELENGRVARYREYFDKGAALLQLGFKPESLAKVLARSL